MANPNPINGRVPAPVVLVGAGRQVKRGAFAAPGITSGADLFAPVGPFNLTLWGTFTGSVTLERLLPGEEVWVPLSKDLTGAAAAFTAPVSLTSSEPEAGTLYRLNCDAVSGTLNWRLSQ